MRTLQHARGSLQLDRCLVMGIVNRTPDSFFDGGRMALDESIAHSHRLVEEGADILDIGAVKAGPGEDVSSDEEATRLLPLIEALRDVGVPISVETARPELAARAIAAGAAIVNDVRGLADPELAAVCAQTGAALVVMHHGGQIRGRPLAPTYDDLVDAVVAEWKRLVGVATGHGLAEDHIVVDPGLDFGKNTFHSLELMRRLSELTAHPWPVLIAPSRKDVVGETLGLGPHQRLEGTLALVAVSVLRGADMVRVHDVEATVRTVRMIEATEGRRMPSMPVRGLWL